MDAIKEWAKQLIFLVLFATFLELLLPGKSMQRFLRVIIGLFLMLAVLKPVASALEYGTQEDIPVFGNMMPAQDAAKMQIESAKQEELKYVVYQRELSRQLKAAAQTVPGVKEAWAEVRLATEVRSDIASVTLWIKPESLREKHKIEVRLDKDEPQAELKPDLKDKIVHRMKELYGISAQKIELRLWRGENSDE